MKKIKLIISFIIMIMIIVLVASAIIVLNKENPPALVSLFKSEEVRYIEIGTNRELTDIMGYKVVTTILFQDGTIIVYFTKDLENGNSNSDYIIGSDIRIYRVFNKA